MIFILVIVIPDFCVWALTLSDGPWWAALACCLDTECWLLQWALGSYIYFLCRLVWLLWRGNWIAMTQWPLDLLGPYPSEHWINCSIWAKSIWGSENSFLFLNSFLLLLALEWTCRSKCMKYTWLLLWLNLNPLVWATCVEKKQSLFRLVLVLAECAFVVVGKRNLGEPWVINPQEKGGTMVQHYAAELWSQTSLK